LTTPNELVKLGIAAAVRHAYEGSSEVKDLQVKSRRIEGDSRNEDVLSIDFPGGFFDEYEPSWRGESGWVELPKWINKDCIHGVFEWCSGRLLLSE
jgi:hypothetical protein